MIDLQILNEHGEEISYIRDSAFVPREGDDFVLDHRGKWTVQNVTWFAQTKDAPNCFWGLARIRVGNPTAPNDRVERRESSPVRSHDGFEP